MKMINIYQPSLGQEELDAIQKVFESNWLGKGKLTEQFVENFSLKLKSSSENFKTICSCTEGLFQSMNILDIGDGDEVILPSISFIGAANAIVSCGAKPIFCDVDSRTLNVSADDIEKNITNKTKAVIILHYAGVPCDMDEIVDLCNRHDIKLIEDNANSPVSKYNDQFTGTIGDIGLWSFDAMKILVMGDGGLVYCKDVDLAKRLDYEAYLGLKSVSGFSNSIDTKWWEFDIELPGRRVIINDITAAIGLEQLKKIDNFISRRKEIHMMYDDRLGLIDWIDVPQKIPGHKTSSYYMYHIQVDKTKRDNLAKYLKDKGIYTSFRYYPLHKVKYFDDGLVLKNTEDIMDKTLCLPLHQSLTDDDVNYICDILYNFNL
jgi:dTDP-4-amino-4,6-dideoxygalactose transaminase|tara:strand:+ start:3973 stop:5100 length:1128 start_codon:yes stop_codon:yes gene_type:complete